MAHSSLGIILFRIIVLTLAIAAWQFAPFGRGMELWVSRPFLILARLWEWVDDGSLWPHLFATGSEMIIGYLLGCASAIWLGLVLGMLPKLNRVLAPFLAAFYAMPKIALAPLFVIFFGIGLESKVALVWITVFFLVFNNTLDGVRDVDRDLIQVLRIMGARRSEIVRKILLPSAAPWIFTGMRIAVRYAFTSALLAELMAANRGLGFLIEYHSGSFDTTGAYAAILVIVILSVGITEILSRIENSAGRGR
jgi:NitT/TauT family transport system permease protein